ncbi:hypothetical protein [Mucisphaera calidilacus]|uniref:Recombination-associated protein RdgC n=1 Tax=Mucisphaera calidilacus TaxID=2527982 RepID=A0A518BTK2_9BACT|nr:hypothetical protein [Mucisphaera calidilacus]QDU70300.1 hypothetical protein Pan265_01230 [Mucisphaera calidilacus]
MSFTSGRVTFSRYLVEGDGPSEVDETALSVLEEHAFVSSAVPDAGEPEVGFVTAEHLLDTRFTHEKVAYGEPGRPLMLAAVRIDTHNPPSELRKAYERMHEAELGSGPTPAGADEMAEHQISQERAEGKFRRSKTVSFLWDLARREVLVGTTAQSTSDLVVSAITNAFAVRLLPLTAGSLAERLLSRGGARSELEDARPSAFTAAPVGREDSPTGPKGGPPLPWNAKAQDLRDFLGDEFLVWLWHRFETAQGEVVMSRRPGDKVDPVAGFVGFTKSLDMDCAWGLSGRQMLRADTPTRLAEAGEALKKGKWPRKAGLLVSDGASHWEFTFAAEQASASSVRLPEIDDVDDPRAVVNHRFALTLDLAAWVDRAYATFIEERLSSGWSRKRTTIRQWIESR